jgi:ribonucleoside-diphosphate reductase alpha chain
MKLINCDFPTIDNTKELEHSYTNGFFSGDGTYNENNIENKKCKNKSINGKAFCKRHIDFDKGESETDICTGISYMKKPIVSLYGEKIDLLQYLDYRTHGEIDKTNNKLNVSLVLDLEEKYFVPINYSLKSKMDWFSGYCDADGCIARNGDNESLQIVSIEFDFLKKIRYMLQTCGINPKLANNQENRSVLLPDGNNDKKYYDCKKNWRLLITSNDLQVLINNGFSPKRLKINIRKPQRNCRRFTEISEVVNENKKGDTYCFTEHKRHAGIFNGILTSQCSEITEYSDDKEYAVCNLASIVLAKFLKREEQDDDYFDFKEFIKVVKVVVKNLNKVIDLNYYPVEETRRSNMRHRPVGLGVQALADLFVRLRCNFESDKARDVNRYVFETMYYAALEASCELAEAEGPYETFKGSPLSEGKFQFDLWDVKPRLDVKVIDEEMKSCTSLSDIFKSHMVGLDWDSLRERIMKNGVRNSLLLSMMPTASTSQIMGSNECIEPFTSNIYIRRTLAGEFVLVNQYLIRDLLKLGLWSEEMKKKIIFYEGSVQQIEEIPKEIRELYKTVWELKQKSLVDLSADRSPFICQSQSLNIFMARPTFALLSKMHFYGWKRGLKTGSYYIRSKPASRAQQFSIDPEFAKKLENKNQNNKDSESKKDKDEEEKNDIMGLNVADLLTKKIDHVEDVRCEMCEG